MKLLQIKSKHKPQKIAIHNGVVGYAWALVVGWFYISLNFDSAWKDGSTRWVHYYSIAITKHWYLGESHNYYDGPHCGFSLGFLHFNWSGDWCNKCAPPEDC
jgi:hypothetical protein